MNYLFCNFSSHSHQPSVTAAYKLSYSILLSKAEAMMNSYKLTIISASLALVLSLHLLNHHHSPAAPADLVLRNAVVFTSDPSLPFAESFAVRDRRILRVGDYSSLEDLVGEKTKVVDVGGKVVVPGFIDSHVHLILGGLEIARVDLQGVNQKDEFVRRVKEAVRNLKQGSWLLGGRWNNDLWGGELPVASWIDHITPNNPVWLSRVDRHMGLANTIALRLAGISNLSEDPDGGSIAKSLLGEPTGLLVDSAMNLIFSCLPDTTVDDRRGALSRASNFSLTKGVTTVVDFGRYFPGGSLHHSWEDLSDVYEWADSLGRMRIRACLFFPMESTSRLHDLLEKRGRALSDRIYLGGVKAFADGSLGSNSALFYEPYVVEPDNNGLHVVDPETLMNMTLEADKSGLQVAVHAIGDKANDMILNMYESVISTNGKRDRRFRIEHVQHLAPESAARFGELGIVASVQPQHLLGDAESAIKRLGMDRAQRGSYLFQSLLAGNAQLALGSDWPVTEINPLESIKVAIKRIPPGWDTAWIPSERLSLSDALISHTISAARACFLDNDLGSLSAGKLADFVVLSATSLAELEADGPVSVEATYISGELAYP